MMALRCSSLVYSIALIAISNANQMPNFSGFGDFGQEGKFCPPFRCTKEYEAVPRRPMKFTSSGCGAAMSGMQVFSPGSDENDPTQPCCDQHNACYQVCGIAKSACDEKLKTCSAKVCDAIEDEDEKKKCSTNAELTQMMVNMSDCRRFDSLQGAACECVDKGKAPEKREAAIRFFYKKYAPDSVDKVPSLAKKADTAKKLAGLLQKLLIKYPQAIKKVKDPQAAQMEEMMRKAREKEDTGGDGTKVEEDEPDEVQEL